MIKSVSCNISKLISKCTIKLIADAKEIKHQYFIQKKKRKNKYVQHAFLFVPFDFL